MKFRKKPVVIDAMQLLWGTWNEMCEHAGVGKLSDGKPEGCYIRDGKKVADVGTMDEIGLQIPTLEGLMIAVQGDWIIRGVKGEIYPVKDDIFRLTYEAVESQGVTVKAVVDVTRKFQNYSSPYDAEEEQK